MKIPKKIIRIFNRIYPKKFESYWKKIKDSENIDSNLKFITDSFIESDSYDSVSNYWHVLNIGNYEMLSKFGIKKYGSTIARNYYTFSDLSGDEIIKHATDNLKDSDNLIEIKSSDFFQKHDGFSFKESIFYNYFCYLLFYNLKLTNVFKYLPLLKNETYLGFNDPHIEIENLNVSIDKVVSLLDYDKINKTFDLKNFKTVLEIGAGSGRTSEAILSIEKNLKYIICDIAPASYLSYERLKKAFPNKKVSLLIDIEDQDRLNEEIKFNDISFIFPHQLKMINQNSLDLTIAIDCMHEMDKKTINYYFDSIEKTSKNFYFSIWENYEVPFSKTLFGKSNRLNYHLGDYKIPKKWKNVLSEKLIFPSTFLSLGFKIS
jgi:SAM-dependent methyltransferase|tara:strand:- start:163 stop:1287 length:1125 start_codon:yes stop_codon:yes gene_type:complete